MEKSLPLANGLPPSSARPTRRPTGLISSILIPLLVCVLIYNHFNPILQSILPGRKQHSTSAACEQPEPLFPSIDEDGHLKEMWHHINSGEFEESSIKRLSGAVQIPTQSFDDLGPIGGDEHDHRWDVMYPFAEYLKKTFPRVHDEMSPEVINTHGLLFTLQGSNEELKPIILMAHQDVVPVPNETVSAWKYPPFSGHYDGKRIWGRGSSDCKNQLIAIMETMELFLAAKFKPKRTVIMSFGFDEEISGREGAGHLSKHLLERYGKDGIAAIVDEGSGFESVWGTTFAKPGTAEKGYTDVHITVRYPGGHSSIPTDHTSIGMLSELITMVEAEQYGTHLADSNPYLDQLQCGAAHSPEFPKSLKKLLDRRESRGNELTCVSKKDHLAYEAAKLGGPAIQYLMQTSQAVDIVSGGVKVNALPERVTATINHRINIGEKPELVWERITKLAEKVAKKHNISLNAFNGVKEAPASISLWPSETTLNPAPVTPAETNRLTPYAVLAGTTRAVFGEDIVVAPGIMTGNTDTRYYWDNTRHIFRYSAVYDLELGKGGIGNIHTVNEFASVAGHIGLVKWFTTFVRNMNEAELED